MRWDHLIRLVSGRFNITAKHSAPPSEDFATDLSSQAFSLQKKKWLF